MAKKLKGYIRVNSGTERVHIHAYFLPLVIVSCGNIAGGFGAGAGQSICAGASVADGAGLAVGAYKFFCGKDLEGAHGAAADTAATWEVLQGELEKFPELPRDSAGLAAFCEQSDPDMVDRTRRFRWMGDDVVINFGKFAGRQLKDIAQNEPGFLRWIIRSDFPEEVKKIASDALIGKYPERKKNAGTGTNN